MSTAVSGTRAKPETASCQTRDASPPLEIAFASMASTSAHYHINAKHKAQKSPLRHERGHNGDWSIYSAKSRKRQIQKTQRNLYMHFN